MQTSWQRALVLACGFTVGAERVASASESSSKRTCPEPAAGAYQHEGFFLRADSGVALLAAHVAESPRGRSRIRGIGQTGNIALGGTPFPGLVIGGSLWTARIDPTFVENGVDVSPDDDSVKLTLGSLGPFVDWYPDPYSGFHLLFAGAATMMIESDTKGEPLRPVSAGAQLAVGAGYEWFLTRDFSMGFLFRMNVLLEARPRPAGPERMLAEVPELLISSTYH